MCAIVSSNIFRLPKLIKIADKTKAPCAFFALTVDRSNTGLGLVSEKDMDQGNAFVWLNLMCADLARNI